MRERVLSVSLIVAVGILTYLCATRAGFLSIDDTGMVRSLTSDSYTLKSLFFPNGANPYYRPLAVVFYAVNAFYCGFDPVSFHLVNVAIHIANSLLVYSLASALFDEPQQKRLAPLLAAILFLVAPINSEAVVWVSARPDLLCTFFFLLALILMVRRREDAGAATFCYAALAYLASLCCKEASIALFAVAPLFLFLRARRESRREAVLFTAAVWGATALYAFLRSGSHLLSDRGVGRVVRGVLGEGAQAKAQGVAEGVHAQAVASPPALLDAAGAYGFYLRKLVYPFPLNFTTLHYPAWSSFLALALALPLSLWLLRRYRGALLPLLVVLVGILPAVLAYMGRIAWTPLGERYLYLPMVGFSLLAALVLADLRRVPRIVPLACLLLYALPTLARASLWCDGTAFWNDCLTKTPGFPKSHSALGVIAFEEVRYDDAEKQFKRAIALGSQDPTVWQNLGRVYLARRDYQEYESAMSRAAALSPRPLAVYIEMIDNLMDAKGMPRPTVYAKAIHYHLQAVSRDPSYVEAYYNAGKLYLALGDRENAQRYLTMYTEKAKNGFYRPFAEKMIRKLAAGNG